MTLSMVITDSSTMFSFLSPPSSPFQPPPILYRILSSPLKFITQSLYPTILFLRGSALTASSPYPSVRLVCISDTHTHKPDSLPPGDVLVHAGDLTNEGSVAEIQDQIDWLASLLYEHIIVVCGNHDSYFDPRARRKVDIGKEIKWGKVHYLQHSSLKLLFSQQGNRQLCFYGAPQIPQCGGKDFAFQYNKGHDAWAGTVPLDTNVLITHTPPRHHRDLPRGMGCGFLLKEVWRVKPEVHIFGHVHAGWGRESAFWDESQRVFEKLCERGERGVLEDFMAVRAWLDVMKLAMSGLLGILWSRVWGGNSGGSLMINAALAYRSTGELGNPPQVVDL